VKLRSLGLWALAFAITAGSAVWQRTSGPTYPVRGMIPCGGETLRYRLPRSGDTGAALVVRIPACTAIAAAQLAWRRYPTDEPWRVVPMAAGPDGALEAAIPSQPPAGKVEYQLRLTGRTGGHTAAPDRAAVARFKGPVPATLLVPHILAMFVGMLFSTRAGLGALGGDDRPIGPARSALALIALGGLVLGPLVQRLAFGALWTGWPFGGDLTDNKTAVAALVWAWAVWRMRRGRPARAAVMTAALVTLAVFSVPHSAWGSELRWADVPPSAPGTGS